MNAAVWPAANKCLVMQLPRLLFLLLLSLSASADVIYLKNGDRITGEINRVMNEEITIDPEYGGEYEVKFEHILRLESDRTMDVELYDGTRGAFQFDEGGEPGQVTLVSGAMTTNVELSEVKQAVEFEDFNWASKLDVSSSFSKGNTDSQLINVQGNSRFLRGNLRYVSDLSIVREKQGDDYVKERDKFRVAYNYIWRNNWYAALDATVERDPIAQLDLRTALNPAIGYDIWDEPDKYFSVQFGAGYASEKSDFGDSSGGNIDFRLSLTYDISRLDLEFFHDQHIYHNLKGRENTVFNTRAGVRYEITDDIYINIQADYDYDFGPPVDTDEKDLTFLIGAGMEL
jgi:putative salt-induced outer membrane protein YdiY